MRLSGLWVIAEGNVGSGIRCNIGGTIMNCSAANNGLHGMATGAVAVEKTGDALTVKLPANAMYVVVE